MTSDITLMEAAFGVEKALEVPRWDNCTGVQGNRSSLKGPVTCSNCKGAGQVRFQQGFFSVSKTCGKCNGEGRIITDPCKKCKGHGKVKAYRDISLRFSRC